MRLQSGARLGPYAIETPLGAGGMGEVYRARDTRLDRSVAIKVLPAEFSANAMIRARFEREAKTISSLTHPNICTLHDIGREGDTDYLVMEYLDGETLADRIERGPVSLDEAIRIGIQVADALDRAHRSGVVHRDLKPGNVMLTPAGAKLLDFGLAKQGGPAEPHMAGLTHHPTQQRPLTEEGTILGTFQYMAPEQLEGQEADARTDIFAFGALLYEMVTGRRPFGGKSRMSLIAAIMEHEPPAITAHQPLSPPALERLIRQCLKKNPDDRWQTAHDLALQLRWIEEGGSQAGLPAPVVARRKRGERISWIVAALSLAAALLAATGWYLAANEPAAVLRTSIVPADLPHFNPDRGIALSPGGERLVYVITVDGKSQLWVRDLGNDEAQPLRGTDDARYPFWSPDGKDIGFFADGKLKRISLSAGAARSLAEAEDGRGGTWSDDGWIVYAPTPGSPLMRIPDAGGATSKLTNPTSIPGVTSHRWPWFLPGGRHLLYLAQTAEGGTEEDASTIRILDVESGQDRKIVDANSSVQYSASGHILYWSQGSILAHGFDAGEGTVEGSPRPLAEGVLYTANEYAAFSQSHDGLFLFQKGTTMGGLSVPAWVESDGTRSANLRQADQYYDPALSPDGTRLCVEGAKQDLWIADLARGSWSRFTFEGANESSPVWSKDGEWVYYASGSGNKSAIRRKRSSGVGGEEVVVERPGRAFPRSISPDGRILLLTERTGGGTLDILQLDLETRKVTPIVATPFIDVFPTFGPTADWITYMSDESGRFEVYAQKISGAGGRWQISTEGGQKPRWSADGKTIYFLRPGQLHAVDVKVGDGLTAGIPRKVFDVGYRPGAFVPYAVAPQGNRFLFVLEDGAQREVSPMTLVQNWTGMLAAR